MNNKPRFITFTGADEHTSIDDMSRLSDEYPVEWGILFSPARQGSGRYPPISFINELVHGIGDLSAHLCGGHARAVIQEGSCEYDGLIKARFWRAQINTSDPNVQPAAIATWARAVAVKPILQCRGPFPDSLATSWLFDASGGRGIEPEAWPAPPEKYKSLMVGYAGGLRPENVVRHVENIQLFASDYWIDMETGVRDENDRFDLERCRRVCEAVYGTR